MVDKPRHPVAQGGFWNTAKPNISKETQNLLKIAMEESKLTNFQQRQLSGALQRGEPLPINCNPTSSAKPDKRVIIKQKCKTVDAKKHNVGIRPLEKIESSGAYERDIFRPEPIDKYKIRDKERLQNIMAFGEDVKPPTLLDLTRKLRQNQELESEKKTKKDRFDELYEEVEERREFLDKMESLGQGKEYRTIINTEISRLIRDMEVIDQKRSAELEQAIKKQQASYKDMS